MFSFEKRALIYHVLFQLRCGTLSPDRRAAAFILAYCPCVITKEKNYDEAGSPRKKGSEAERSGEDDGATEGGRRGEETVSKRKRNILSAENEVKRDREDSEKKKEKSGRENIKDIARGTRCSE